MTCFEKLSVCSGGNLEVLLGVYFLITGAVWKLFCDQIKYCFRMKSLIALVTAWIEISDGIKDCLDWNLCQHSVLLGSYSLIMLTTVSYDLSDNIKYCLKLILMDNYEVLLGGSSFMTLFSVW